MQRVTAGQVRHRDGNPQHLSVKVQTRLLFFLKCAACCASLNGLNRRTSGDNTGVTVVTSSKFTSRVTTFGWTCWFTSRAWIWSDRECHPVTVYQALNDTNHSSSHGFNRTLLSDGISTGKMKNLMKIFILTAQSISELTQLLKILLPIKIADAIDFVLVLNCAPAPTGRWLGTFSRLPTYSTRDFRNTSHTFCSSCRVSEHSGSSTSSAQCCFLFFFFSH